MIEAAWLAARVVLAGWPWAAARSGDPDDGAWVRAGLIALYGLFANLIPVLVLAALGIWTPMLDVLAWAAVVAIGFTRARRAGWRAASTLRAGGVVALLVVIGAVAPPRSEWLAGGWDPGLYQNNAVAIADRQGWVALSGGIHARLTEQERLLVSEAEGDYREAFPGVPLTVETGDLPLYFFPLTPICGAWLYRLGGYELLVRLPAILALLGLPVVAAMVRRWGPSASVCCGFFWLVAPLWWYQQAIPTAEMLYLVLLTGGWWLARRAAEQDQAWPVGVAWAFGAATVNHFNFPVIGALLLTGLALLDESPTPRRVMSRYFAGHTGLLLGILVNALLADVTLDRLQQKDQVWLAVMIPYGLLLASGWVLAWVRPGSRAAGKLGEGAGYFALVVGVGIIGLVALLHLPGLATAWPEWLSGTRMGDILNRVRLLMAFTGAGPWILTALGMLALAGRCADRTVMPWLVFVLLCGAATSLFLCLPGIAGIYPWALRRYVPTLLPFMAFAQGFFMWWCWRNRHAWPKGWSALAAGALLWGAVDAVRLTRDAIRVGDYPGMVTLVREFAAATGLDEVIVADDPRWGTPLLLAEGRQVLNARPLWQSKNPEHHRAFLEMIRRLQQEEGLRVVWLTSTRRGMAIYPVEIPVEPEPQWEKTFAYRTIVHSARGTVFRDEAQTRTFRLYEGR